MFVDASMTPSPHRHPRPVSRFRAGLPLAASSPTMLYAEGAKGYTDYPAYGAG